MDRTVASRVEDLRASLTLLVHQRGFWLDAFAFVLNVLALSTLSGFMRHTIHKASTDDPGAARTLFALGIALFVLAPLGATLSRWQFHQRRGKDAPEVDAVSGCLFNPVFYFCLTAVIFATINAFILQSVYGNREPNGDVFVTSIFAGIALMIAHTVLVYRYFSKPTKPPRWRFLQSKASGAIGDVCLFVNMAIFQSFWSLLGTVKAPPPTGAFDVFARLTVLFFLALLLYFPPRIFYLAEDMGKRWVWVSVLLANSPILVRFVLGSAQYSAF